MPGPVERWLETFMCKQYADTFEAYGFKTLQSVCQLQQPQLQAMGVAQEHIEKILESVHVLRQSMFGGMNHYKDDGYSGQSNNRIQHTGYNIPPPQAHNMGSMNPNYMSQGGYNNNQGNIMAAHRGQMMDNMYQQHSQNHQYPPYNNQNQGPYQMGQYNQQNSSYGPMMGYNQNQPRMQNHTSTAASYLHARQQNPQEVANNILQMAASYQPSQTVQVPLSKHRSAPYHVPVTAHYNMQNHVPNAEQMNRQFNYPNTSPHNPHAARTSPVSPGYMHSPASQHSAQSLPNSSPRSIHSPPACGNIKSPVPTPSPAGSMRSPCHMQSPVNTPINQQLHISTSQQMMPSPHHPSMGYSPKNNPISPPVPSPHYKQQHGHHKTYISENVGNSGTNFTANSPLQSLQKLCMLPDQQVVDPKSIVSDSSSSPNQNQKNSNSDADSNSRSTPTISEAASINLQTDGSNCDESIPSQTNSLTNMCSDSANNSSLKKKETVVESYADDAVKNSADNTVKVEVDIDRQKLKYLGQPCNTGSNLTKQTLSDSNHEQDKTVEYSQENHQNGEKGMEDSCQNKSENHQNGEKEMEDSFQNKSDENVQSCKKSQCLEQSLNSQVEAINGNSEKLQEANKKQTQETNNIEHSTENSHTNSEESRIKLDDVQNNDIKSENDIDSEPVQNICDNSVVDGCDNIHCDEQPKTDISSDCRKDEVKSMVNGVDDSDDVCSDEETTKKDILVENEQKIDQEKTEIKFVNKLKNEQKYKKEKNEQKRILREIPARLASASPYYVDASDSDDDGILLVRKDVKYTYSRYNKIHRDINSHVSVSDNEIVDISDEESLDRNSLDSDISKGFDCDLIRPPKPVCNKTKSGSNPGHSKKNGNTKLLKKKTKNAVNSGKVSEGQTENQRGTCSKRSKRTRISTSKYGDEMYLGDDFALDSEEEIEIEKKSKKKRKASGDPKPNTKVKSEDIVVDSDEEVEVEDINKKKRKASGDQKPNVKSECADSSNDILDAKEICIDIIDSSDNLGDGSDIITFKGTSNKIVDHPEPSTSKSENKPSAKKSKPKTKSKPKISKGGKSKSRGKLLDDSIKNMKLKKTMNLMKQKGKKKVEAPVKETGPFLRIKDSGTPKEKCSVVNQQLEEVRDKASKNKKTSVQVSTVHMSKLPSEKSVYLPASQVGEDTAWVCVLCQKHSSYKFLGDLFGPYYIEGSLLDDDGPSSSDKKGKQKRQSLNNSIESKITKGRRKSKESARQQEVWVHEDCAAWADGVLLIGAKIYGLQEAANIASTTVCTCCKEIGAMVGCLHKGCSQKFHYYCGIESGCYLDEENYSLLCPKHRDKRLKSAEAKAFKT